jgi:hypothetical protein
MLRLTLPIEALKIIDLIPDWPQADGVLVVQSTRSITLTWRDTGILAKIDAARNAAAGNETLLRKFAEHSADSTSDSLEVRMANWANWLRNGIKVLQRGTDSVN